MILHEHTPQEEREQIENHEHLLQVLDRLHATITAMIAKIETP
jgi:ribosome assembly protein YihI (activator of Der GTPase)